MHRLFMLLFMVPIISFAKNLSKDNVIPVMVEVKIKDFVSRNYKPFALSNPRYVDGFDVNNKPYYIYANLIKKIESTPVHYVYPYAYSTEGVGHTSSAFDKCNLLLTQGNQESYQIENKKTDRFSPCLGFKDIKIIDAKDKTWLASTVGYMLPQNSEISDRDDYFFQELYFIDKVKHNFCFVEGDPLLSEVISDTDELKKKITQLESADVTCIAIH